MVHLAKLHRNRLRQGYSRRQVVPIAQETARHLSMGSKGAPSRSSLCIARHRRKPCKKAHRHGSSHLVSADSRPPSILGKKPQRASLHGAAATEERTVAIAAPDLAQAAARHLRPSTGKKDPTQQRPHRIRQQQGRDWRPELYRPQLPSSTPDQEYPALDLLPSLQIPPPPPLGSQRTDYPMGCYTKAPPTIQSEGKTTSVSQDSRQSQGRMRRAAMGESMAAKTVFGNRLSKP